MADDEKMKNTSKQALLSYSINHIQLLNDKFDERMRIAEKEIVRLNTIWRTIVVVFTFLMSFGNY